jgi:hypothetical protein
MRCFAVLLISLSSSFFFAFDIGSCQTATEAPKTCQELALTAGFNYPKIDETAPVGTVIASGLKETFKCKIKV